MLEALKDILPDNKIGFEMDAEEKYNELIPVKHKVGQNQTEEVIEQP